MMPGGLEPDKFAHFGMGIFAILLIWAFFYRYRVRAWPIFVLILLWPLVWEALTLPFTADDILDIWWSYAGTIVAAAAIWLIYLARDVIELMRRW